MIKIYIHNLNNYLTNKINVYTKINYLFCQFISRLSTSSFN